MSNVKGKMNCGYFVDINVYSVCCFSVNAKLISFSQQQQKKGERKKKHY